MKEMIQEHCWRVRADPFYPEYGAKGQPLAPNAYQGSLDPNLDPAILPIFFDVYNWDYSTLVAGLSPEHGLDTFPTPHTLHVDAPLMVVISGARQTGLDSLANLVAFKAERISDKQLLLCKVRLDGRDPAQNVLSVAEQFIDSVENKLKAPVDKAALAKSMRDRLDRAKQDQAGRSDATYSDVFRAFNMMLEPFNLELVVRIASGGDPYSWARIYQSLHNFAGCVIVTTSELAAAKTCYETLSTSDKRGNVCWIQALPLKREDAYKFVRARIADVRLVHGHNSLPSLLPFTEDAIDILFKPGSAAAKGDPPVAHPIGWIRKTLYKAIVDRIDELKKTHAGMDSATLAAMNPDQVVIDAARVAAARDKLNKGVK